MRDFNVDLRYLISGMETPNIGHIVMIVFSFVLIYHAIHNKQNILLLLPMGISMLAVNLPLPHISENVIYDMTNFMLKGAITGIYPLIIFFVIGTMIDLGLLLADPKNFFIGASSQVGIFIIFAFVGYLFYYFGIDLRLAASTSIIGLADGGVAMYLSALLTPDNFAAISIAAYLYTGILPKIQPKIIIKLTTDKERNISMPYLRHVERGEKIIFAFIVIAICGIFLPNAFPLIGALMFGTILREADIIDTFPKELKKSFLSILTIVIGIAIGGGAYSTSFLTANTLLIFIFGFLSFIFSTSMGIITAKIMNIITKGKINPIIGSAGISAFPIPSWNAHLLGQEIKSSNCLLLHAMAVNIAGIISGAICVGIFITFFE